MNDYNQNSISTELQKKIILKINKIIKKTDLIILSDFNCGALPKKLIENIIKIANNNKIIVTADSQSSSQIGYINKYKNVNLLTPTEYEARVSVSTKNQEDGIPVVNICKELQQDTKTKNLIMKLGSDGVFIHSLLNKKIFDDTIQALNPNPVDIAGAGDHY